MRNYDSNEKYKTILEKLKNFNKEEKAIVDVKEILGEIDELILSSSDIVLDEDFILAFYSIMRLEYNGSCIGDIILDDTLTKKEKLSPSLIIYYYMKQKEQVNSADYNFIEFTKQKYVVMATTHFDNNQNNMIINYDYFLNKYPGNEEFNYQVMESILHEMNHVYQFSIDPDSDNIYERIIYNDVKIWEEFLKINSMINYIRVHSYFMVEFQAFINSKSYMTQYAKNNPRYFSDEIISSHEKENVKFFKKYASSNLTPRQLFNEIIEMVLDEAYDCYDDEEYDKILATFNRYLGKEKELIALIQNQPDTWEKFVSGCVGVSMEEYKKAKSL